MVLLFPVLPLELSLLLAALPLLPPLGVLEAVLPEVLSGVVAVDELGGGIVGVVTGGVLAIGLGAVVVELGGVEVLRLQPASAAMIASAISVGAGR